MEKYTVYLKSTAFGFAIVEASSPEDAIKRVIELHDWEDVDMQVEMDNLYYADQVEKYEEWQ